MEFLFQFFDEVDDLIIAMAIRLQRSLSRTPQERRRLSRTPDITPKPTTTPGWKPTNQATSSPHRKQKQSVGRSQLTGQ